MRWHWGYRCGNLLGKRETFQPVEPVLAHRKGFLVIGKRAKQTAVDNFEISILTCLSVVLNGKQVFFCSGMRNRKIPSSWGGGDVTHKKPFFVLRM